MAEIDFETYSEAGYTWSPALNRWVPVSRSKPGIGAVGAAAYAEHPSTDILCLAYNIGNGPQLWVPGMWVPDDLFAHIAAGGIMEAHNSIFEYLIWLNVAQRRYFWPALPLDQLGCSAARARAFSLPGALAKASMVLGLFGKNADGDRLIKKFSIPRNPTAKDSRRRIRPEEEPDEAARLYNYCLQDIAAERQLTERLPELSPSEARVWQTDQAINTRGVHVDRAAMESCIAIVEQAIAKYTGELRDITGGAVGSANEIQTFGAWLVAHGAPTDSLTAESVEYMLAMPDLSPEVHRALEIRAVIGASAVKKLFSIRAQLCGDDRLRDLFSYCGALGTGRWAGKGPQPQNLPPSLPDMDAALAVIATRDLATVEAVYGDPIAAVSGCLRGLFDAAPGYDLICSDYKAIEAVVLAELAGETWRQEVFRGHGMIYEMSASKITGIPFEEFTAHRERTGEHHPARKTIGKVAELASGYQGGLGAWKRFGADKHLSDDKIKAAVAAWRAASPAIVKFWYAMENCAIAAIQQPGTVQGYRGINFQVRDDILHARLLSGRELRYHTPRLRPDVTPWGREVLKISYMAWSTNPQGWLRFDTYGGCLVENICQSTAREILAAALVGLEAAGYRPVLHVHDEPVGEVPEGWGTIEEFEALMTALPEWARGWPIKTGGGWRGKRYRK